MFRKKSLDKMMHPDSLDQLLVVVTPKAVFTFATLALILAIGLVWSITARIPVTVDGSGILLKPRSLKTIQASAAGLLTEVRVAVGQTVTAGEIIAKVDQPELERQLELEIAKYKAIREFNDKALDVSTRMHGNRPGRTISAARLLQESATARLGDLSATQNANLEKTRAMLKELRDSQALQLKNITDLVHKGIASETQRLNAKGALNDTESRLADVDVRIKQNSMTRIDAEQQALRRTQELEQQDSTLAASIRVLKERVHRQSAVRTQFRGRILEIGSSVGQMTSAGQRIFIMQIEPQEPFFRVEMGSEVSRGSFVLIAGDAATPPLPHDAAAEQIRGALQGLPSLADTTVQVTRTPGRPVFDILVKPRKADPLRARPRIEVRDSDLADAEDIPSFAAVFELGDLVEEEDLKHLGFFPVGQGKRVRPGMEIRINPTNVERQRYGSIMGVVTKVSEFPVTTEGVVNMIGNTDVAKNLLEHGGTMLVEAEATKDPGSPTGLKWTSSGPPEPMTAGTTTTCRITLETRAPITFALPLLRSWVLGDADKLPTR